MMCLLSHGWCPKSHHCHCLALQKRYQLLCCDKLSCSDPFFAFMAGHLLGWAGLFWMRSFTTVGAFLTAINWLRSTGWRAKALNISRSFVRLLQCKVWTVFSPSGLLRIACCPRTASCCLTNRFAFSRVSSESICSFAESEESRMPTTMWSWISCSLSTPNSQSAARL